LLEEERGGRIWRSAVRGGKRKTPRSTCVDAGIEGLCSRKGRKNLSVYAGEKGIRLWGKTLSFLFRWTPARSREEKERELFFSCSP